RFAAAVQAAMEDGYRVFAELSPHPLLTHAVDQNANSLDVSAVALATMRRAQEAPHGLREVLVDLYTAGATVDFAVLYPQGSLVDAPLPVWTHPQLMFRREARRSVVGAGATATHPLLGAHVRLPEEPEYNVWQADTGTDLLPWLGDHQVHHVAAFPAAAYCEMALVAARTVFGDGAEVRGLTFDEMLLLDGCTPVSARASHTVVGSAAFTVETQTDGERVRRAAATLTRSGDPIEPAPHDLPSLLAAHPVTLDGQALRAWFGERGIHYGPAFGGLSAVHTGHEGSVLAEVALPGVVRSQQADYDVHPALLDACFQAVAAHPDLQADLSGATMLPLGVRHLRRGGSMRDARYCHIVVTAVTPAAVDADLAVLDEAGSVLLSLSGLQLGTGMSKAARRERVFNDRLLAIDWQRQDLPEVELSGERRWLVVSTSQHSDGRAAELAAALGERGADVTTAASPVSGIGPQAITGVVAVVSGQGAEAVSRLADIAREVAGIPGVPPRFYALTAGAQPVFPDDPVNLDHAGVRGLMRVIGVENPALRATQVDIDDDTDIGLVAAQLVTGSDEDETAWRSGAWFVARLNPSPMRPEDRHTKTVKHDCDGMRIRIRKPGDLQSLELVAADRRPPAQGQIEVAVTASNLNFADVLVAYGKYPSFEGRLPELGGDFAGVVTRVGPGVTTHQMGDRVAGITADGAWATYATCDANLAATLPAGLPEERAAAVPSAHATAWYSL
ncbi:polyketide synthase, partial [Mycobacterium sp. ITM-2017-0098]